MRVTKRGKLIRRHMGLGHNAIKQSTHQKKRKRGTFIIHKNDIKSMVKLKNKT